MLLTCLIILNVDKITGVYVNGKGSVSLDVCREQYAQTLMSGVTGETSCTSATFMSPGAKYGEAVTTGHGCYFFLFNVRPVSQYSVVKGNIVE